MLVLAATCVAVNFSGVVEPASKLMLLPVAATKLLVLMVFQLVDTLSALSAIPTVLTRLSLPNAVNEEVSAWVTLSSAVSWVPWMAVEVPTLAKVAV